MARFLLLATLLLPFLHSALAASPFAATVDPLSDGDLSRCHVQLATSLGVVREAVDEVEVVEACSGAVAACNPFYSNSHVLSFIPECTPFLDDPSSSTDPNRTSTPLLVQQVSSRRLGRREAINPIYLRASKERHAPGREIVARSGLPKMEKRFSSGQRFR